MRRPLPFTLICWWFGLYLLALTSPIAQAIVNYSRSTTPVPFSLLIAQCVYACLVIVLLVGLYRLRPAFIWVAAVLSGLCAAGVGFRLVTLIASGAWPVTIGVAAVATVLWAITATYLARPQFREFTARFREHRELLDQRRYAERAIRKTAAK